jgi:hypothetical protein
MKSSVQFLLYKYKTDIRLHIIQRKNVVTRMMKQSNLIKFQAGQCNERICKVREVLNNPETFIFKFLIILYLFTCYLNTV